MKTMRIVGFMSLLVFAACSTGDRHVFTVEGQQIGRNTLLVNAQESGGGDLLPGSLGGQNFVVHYKLNTVERAKEVKDFFASGEVERVEGYAKGWSSQLGLQNEVIDLFKDWGASAIGSYLFGFSMPKNKGTSITANPELYGGNAYSSSWASAWQNQNQSQWQSQWQKSSNWNSNKNYGSSKPQKWGRGRDHHGH